MRITSGPASSENHSDMEFQIHCLETEAYGAVLRAFIAQSDVLSWGKEELITELRKELRVSDVEHREILGKINLDDTIKSIRGRRNGSEAQQLTAMNPPASDLMGGHSSCKRLKPAHMTPVVSSPRYPTAQPSAVPLSPLSMHVTNDLWNSKTTVFCPQMSAGQSPIPVPQKRQPPNSGKVRGTVLVKTTKKGFVQSGFGNMKPESGIIEMLATDKLIREVEKVCGEANPDRAQLERAKVVLKEHERALMDAIGKISSISEGDDSPDYKQMQYQYSSEERQRKTPGVHTGVYEQFDRSRSYYNDGYNINHSERAGIPCIDLGNDDYP